MCLKCPHNSIGGSGGKCLRALDPPAHTPQGVDIRSPPRGQDVVPPVLQKQLSWVRRQYLRVPMASITVPAEVPPQQPHTHRFPTLSMPIPTNSYQFPIKILTFFILCSLGIKPPLLYSSTLLQPISPWGNLAKSDLTAFTFEPACSNPSRPLVAFSAHSKVRFPAALVPRKKNKKNGETTRQNPYESIVTRRVRYVYRDSDQPLHSCFLHLLQVVGEPGVQAYARTEAKRLEKLLEKSIHAHCGDAVAYARI